MPITIWVRCTKTDKVLHRTIKTAVKWYRLAAEEGYAVAQSNLGTMYQNGQGVIQDNVYAHMWYNIAASSGLDFLTKNRDLIAKQMTPADISKAQEMAREWMKNFEARKK
jgi:uncharacterized protein